MQVFPRGDGRSDHEHGRRAHKKASKEIMPYTALMFWFQSVSLGLPLFPIAVLSPFKVYLACRKANCQNAECHHGPERLDIQTGNLRLIFSERHFSPKSLTPAPQCRQLQQPHMWCCLPLALALGQWPLNLTARKMKAAKGATHTADATAGWGKVWVTVLHPLHMRRMQKVVSTAKAALFECINNKDQQLRITICYTSNRTYLNADIVHCIDTINESTEWPCPMSLQLRWRSELTPISDSLPSKSLEEAPSPWRGGLPNC